MGRTLWSVGMVLGLAAPLVLGSAARAEPMPVVVELFTSQGCSSCPPADRLLGELAGRPGVIALAYHIDYWDRLGWKDPFSLPAATARQNAYTRALNLQNLYTPQMVIGGKTDVVGFDRPAVLAAMQGKGDGVPIHLSRADGKLLIELGAGRAGEITVLAYSGETETRVARGENAGRVLKDHAIVRAVYPMGQWDGTAKSLSLNLASVPDSATIAAVLVQSAGQGPMQGAATIPLR
ncbi:hypothetical protein CCC_01506 [Paramagnetospirillum magnetotacticum MS-1]|uniref:DUF1223 domain-containing protein n=1 Tax=Paramagnetospirillum magnetotacticum MS-1 TaxID=272627 RepID=A0A0C2Z0B8_PARME|nr:DUF1223 domain-containing protein [Paramagnetospirillum magnetotacticum]KIM00351.1 hypothetical protein CCC_01506 [Paramagnetospirillum magnetotacticum MS-1]